ncbi:MAG: hypothetical protein JWQ11_165 [Rhizobacter sp.]|nr:hypothetical protein [Rhizobacter sp.]
MLNPGRTGRTQDGTTIIETVVVLAIVGVLASMTYPSLAQQGRKTRRLDAVIAISKVQQAQERFRAERSAYADGFVTQGGQADAPLLRMADAVEAGRLANLRSTDGHYLLRVTAADSRGFTVVATARAAQSNDRPCGSMSMTLDGDVVVYASSTAGSTVDTEARHRCWSR